MSAERTQDLIDRAEAPAVPSSALLLAHGAGAGMDSDFMQQMAGLIAGLGLDVIRFEFPYMQQRRQTGSRRPPDRLPKLMDGYFSRLAQYRGDYQTLLIGGKSMGGRVASMIADQVRVEGLVCLGYPFHPQRQPDRLRIEHLQELRTRTLIVQGSRDALGNREEVAAYPLSESIELLWLEDGDHSFKPRVRSGFTQAEHLLTAARAVVQFALQVARKVARGAAHGQASQAGAA